MLYFHTWTKDCKTLTQVKLHKFKSEDIVKKTIIIVEFYLMF